VLDAVERRFAELDEDIDALGAEFAQLADSVGVRGASDIQALRWSFPCQPRAWLHPQCRAASSMQPPQRVCDGFDGFSPGRWRFPSSIRFCF
jgi:hypothetical protein